MHATAHPLHDLMFGEVSHPEVVPIHSILGLSLICFSLIGKSKYILECGMH